MSGLFPGSSSLGASGDGGHEENLVAVLKSVLWAAQETNVLVVHIDVKKRVGTTIALREGFLHPRELLLEAIKKLMQVASGNLHRCTSSRKFLERSRNMDGNGQINLLTAC
jgi:hypothetical protein